MNEQRLQEHIQLQREQHDETRTLLISGLKYDWITAKPLLLREYPIATEGIPVAMQASSC